MINRFSEMVNQGVARPRYNVDFTDYTNNLYHTTDPVVRYYNSVWGALTDTNMRYNNLNASYIITGSYLRSGKFDQLLDMTHFGTTWFATSFPGTDITTLREFFTHFNLCGARCSYNGEIAFVLTSATTCKEGIHSIIAQYKFDDEKIVPCDNETICSAATLQKFSDYCCDHGEDVRHYLTSYCNSAVDDCDKCCEIAGCLFPFASCDPTPYKVHKVINVLGCGTLGLDGTCIEWCPVSGERCSLDLNDNEFIDKFVDKLGFMHANV